MKRLLLLFVLVGAVGCGSLFNSKIKTISMTSTPTQAEVWIDGTLRGVTPLSLALDNQESHTVTFRKEGHQDVICELRSDVGAGWIILDILGGVLPVVVDAVTGDWNGIGEDSCNVGLPEDPVDETSDIAKVATENGWVMLR